MLQAVGEVLGFAVAGPPGYGLSINDQIDAVLCHDLLRVMDPTSYQSLGWLTWILHKNLGGISLVPTGL
jgi:hypothetical protein